MESIQQMLKTALNTAKPMVLAMIIKVEGSAYRKEGAWMILQEDGYRTGVISGGCLESDVQSRATTLFNTGKVDLVEYDLSAEDDLGWGRGAGCNGVVSVLIRDIDHNFRNFLSLMYKRLLDRKPVLLLQSINSFDNYAFLSDSGNHLNNWQKKLPIELKTYTPFQTKVGYINNVQKGDSTYFQLIWPQPTLFIIGAGVDARPLARLAEGVGYIVHLYDRSSELCTTKHFPTATAIQVGNVPGLIADVTFTSLDSVVIMTHDFQLDQKLVQQLRKRHLLYLGILGSKKRTERLLEGEIPSGIYSPVGLSIGADGPEEIAVSIVAELIAVRRGRKL